MKLDEYVKNSSQVLLAKRLGVAPTVIWMWRKGKRTPSPRNCLAIEKATGGAVTRQELRPDDWKEIWQE